MVAFLPPFTFDCLKLMFQFSILCCDNAVFNVWLRLGTKKTHEKILFWLKKKNQRMFGKCPHVSLKTFGFVDTKTAGKFPDVSLKMSKHRLKVGLALWSRVYR